MKRRSVSNMKIANAILMTYLLAYAYPVLSQSVVYVEPGSGTLEAAIQSAVPGDTLELTSGGVYTLSADVSSFGNIGMPLTITVENGASERAVLQLGPDASLTKKYYFFNINDSAALTLRGLEIHGLLNDSPVAASMLVFDCRPDPSTARIGNFRLEDCIFHDFTDYIVHGMKDSYARGAIQDTVFINNVTVYHAKHFLQYKHVSLHHLEMTNTTVYGLQGMALKIGKIGYRTVAGVTDPTITPTGFIDHCTLDDLGDIHGHIQVDDAYHLLTISNCIISHQQQYDQPPVYFTGPAVNPAVSIQNTGFWEVGPPNAEVGGEDWIGYEFSDTTYKDPRYLGAPGGDFSLPDNSIYLSWSSENGQIGDTNWGTYVATGLSGDRISGEQELQILQTYPNPFCNETTIQYLLTKKEMVSIKIYAASGKEIITLENTVRDSGIHIKTWYAKECEAGIYFCIMEAGETSGVKKLILIK